MSEHWYTANYEIEQMGNTAYDYGDKVPVTAKLVPPVGGEAGPIFMPEKVRFEVKKEEALDLRFGTPIAIEITLDVS